MRNRALALSIFSVSILAAFGAHAEEQPVPVAAPEHIIPIPEPVQDKRDCFGTLYGKVASDYTFLDFAQQAADDPVVQSGLAATCGKVTADLWNSAEVDGGSYGNRGGGDEWDLTLKHNDQVGSFVTEASMGLYLFDLGQGLGSLRDDMVGFQVDVARPITKGRLTVAPYVHGSLFLGIADINDVVIVRTGIRPSYRLTDKVTVGGDVAWSTFWTAGTRQTVARQTAFASYNAGAGYSFAVEFYDTNHTKPGLGFAFAKRLNW